MSGTDLWLRVACPQWDGVSAAHYESTGDLIAHDHRPSNRNQSARPLTPPDRSQSAETRDASDLTDCGRVCGSEEDSLAQVVGGLGGKVATELSPAG